MRILDLGAVYASAARDCLRSTSSFTSNAECLDGSPLHVTAMPRRPLSARTAAGTPHCCLGMHPWEGFCAAQDVTQRTLTAHHRWSHLPFVSQLMMDKVIAISVVAALASRMHLRACACSTAQHASGLTEGLAQLLDRFQAASGLAIRALRLEGMLLLVHHLQANPPPFHMYSPASGQRF